jgi:hypothetical protein
MSRYLGVACAVLLVAGCRREASGVAGAPIAESARADAGDRASADAGGSDGSQEAGPVVRRVAPALSPPSSRPVKPKLSLVVNDDGELHAVRAEGLPAISTDGLFVAVLAKDERPVQCVASQLLLFRIPPRSARGRVPPKIAWRSRFLDFEGGCALSSALGPNAEGPSRELVRTRAALAAAEARLAALDLRTFDGGFTWSAQLLLVPEPEPPRPSVWLDFNRDESGLTLRVRARGHEGPLFDLDLAPIRERSEHSGSVYHSGILNGGEYDVDVAARILVVRGTYFSANAWLPADATTHVLTW